MNPLSTGMALARVGAISLAFGSARAAPDAQHGAELYAKRCAQCHGETGEADGPAATTMLPRPRVFKDNSSYKIRTTGSGELPTDQDLFNVVSRGLPGSSMPSFDRLSESDRWDLVATVKSLSVAFTDPDYTSTAVALPELALPKPVATSPDSVAKGAQLYEENQCRKCHGALGRGDGPSWDELTDDWDHAIVPANLSNPESFRGGGAAFDIYRTISTGLNGTPMPSYADSITPEDRWHLVNYVVSLAPPSKEFRDEAVFASLLPAVPTSGADPAWDQAPPARFRTLPNIIEAPRLYWPSVEFVTVQALYSQDELALRVQWDDRAQSTGTDTTDAYPDKDGTPYLTTQHPDQLAVQFPGRRNDSARPYFLMGDNKRAVNLWWWRSDAQGAREVNAKGFGKYTEQPQESQELKSELSYADGRYTLTLRRSLKTANEQSDVQFEPGLFVPISFHLWDGNRGEIGQRRALTTWYWLFLQPGVPKQAYIAPPLAFLVSLGLLGLVVQSTRRRAAHSGRSEGP